MPRSAFCAGEYTAPDGDVYTSEPNDEDADAWPSRTAPVVDTDDAVDAADGRGPPAADAGRACSCSSVTAARSIASSSSGVLLAKICNVSKNSSTSLSAAYASIAASTSTSPRIARSNNRVACSAGHSSCFTIISNECLSNSRFAALTAASPSRFAASSWARRCAAASTAAAVFVPGRVPPAAAFFASLALSL
jgi:hypothetical protein